MKKVAFLLTLCGALAITAKPAFADDIEEISKVVQQYFDGTAQGKPELVSKAFLPSLELQHVGKDGALRRWWGTDYVGRIVPGEKKEQDW